MRHELKDITMSKRMSRSARARKRRREVWAIRIGTVLVFLAIVAGVFFLVRACTNKDNTPDDSKSSVQASEDNNKGKEKESSKKGNSADVEPSSEEPTEPFVVPASREVVYTRADVEIADGFPEISYDSDYVIRVNIPWQTVTVYRLDAEGNEDPIKAFACSTARGAHETPEDTYYMGSWYRDDAGWCYMVDGTWGQYAYSIHRACDGLYEGYMFHCVPYLSASKDSLEWVDYNKLGTPASMGCIRLNVADARWLIANVGHGAAVEIYSDETTPGPLGKPETFFIPEELGESLGWDPSDPDSDNPWHSYEFTMEIDDYITVDADDDLDITDFIYAEDIYGNDLSGYAAYTLNQAPEGSDAEVGGKYGFYFTTIDREDAPDYSGDPTAVDPLGLISYGYEGMDASTPGDYEITVKLSVGPYTAEKYVRVTIE